MRMTPKSLNKIPKKNFLKKLLKVNQYPIYIKTCQPRNPPPPNPKLKPQRKPPAQRNLPQPRPQLPLLPQHQNQFKLHQLSKQLQLLKHLQPRLQVCLNKSKVTSPVLMSASPSSRPCTLLSLAIFASSRRTWHAM